MRPHASELTSLVREIFPELCGEPVDLEAHAPSVIIRALNDGSPELQNAVVRHYGLERVKQVARKAADRLTNPAYRAWRKRLDLPGRSLEIAFVQGLWMR